MRGHRPPDNHFNDGTPQDPSAFSPAGSTTQPCPPPYRTFVHSKSAKTFDSAAPDSDEDAYTDSECGSRPGSRAGSRPQSPARHRPRPPANALERVRRGPRRHSSSLGDRPSSGRSHTAARELLAALAGLGPEATRLFLRLPRTGSQSGASTPPLSARNSTTGYMAVAAAHGGSGNVEVHSAGPASRERSSNGTEAAAGALDAEGSTSSIRRTIAAARKFGTMSGALSGAMSPRHRSQSQCGGPPAAADAPVPSRKSMSQDGLQACMSPGASPHPTAQQQRRGSSSGRQVAMAGEAAEREEEEHVSASSSGLQQAKERSGSATPAERTSAPHIRSSNVNSPLMQVAGALAQRNQFAQGQAMRPRPPSADMGSSTPTRTKPPLPATPFEAAGSGSSSPVQQRRVLTDGMATVPAASTDAGPAHSGPGRSSVDVLRLQGHAQIGAGTVPQEMLRQDSGGSAHSGCQFLPDGTAETATRTPVRGVLRPSSAMVRSPGAASRPMSAMTTTALVATAAVRFNAPRPPGRPAGPRTPSRNTSLMGQWLEEPGSTEPGRCCYSDSGVAPASPHGGMHGGMPADGAWAGSGGGGAWKRGASRAGVTADAAAVLAEQQQPRAAQQPRPALQHTGSGGFVNDVCLERSSTMGRGASMQGESSGEWESHASGGGAGSGGVRQWHKSRSGEEASSTGGAVRSGPRGALWASPVAHADHAGSGRMSDDATGQRRSQGGALKPPQVALPVSPSAGAAIATAAAAAAAAAAAPSPPRFGKRAPSGRLSLDPPPAAGTRSGQLTLDIGKKRVQPELASPAHKPPLPTCGANPPGEESPVLPSRPGPLLSTGARQGTTSASGGAGPPHASLIAEKRPPASPHMAAAVALCTTPAQPVFAGHLPPSSPNPSNSKHAPVGVGVAKAGPPAAQLPPARVGAVTTGNRGLEVQAAQQGARETKRRGSAAGSVTPAAGEGEGGVAGEDERLVVPPCRLS